MSTMIERIAEFLKTRDEHVLPDEADDEERRGSAVAILELMREPTERMVSEGESAAKVGIGKCGDDEALPRVWHWMIDAALKERP